MVYREWSEKEKMSSEQQFSGQYCLAGVRGEWPERFEMIESQITPCYNRLIKKRALILAGVLETGPQTTCSTIITWSTTLLTLFLT